jgi:hypothetical protein
MAISMKSIDIHNGDGTWIWTVTPRRTDGGFVVDFWCRISDQFFCVDIGKDDLKMLAEALIAVCEEKVSEKS